MNEPSPELCIDCRVPIQFNRIYRTHNQTFGIYQCSMCKREYTR